MAKTTLSQKSKSKAKAKRADRLKTKSGLLETDRFREFVRPGERHGYHFWTHHVLNFFASDYHNGVWEPLFPEIYKNVEVPAKATHTRVLQKFLDTSTNRLSDTGVKCILWMSLKNHEMFRLVLRLRLQIRKLKGNPIAERDPKAWVVVDMLGQQLKDSCNQWEEFKGVQLDYENLVADSVDKVLVDLSKPLLE